MDSYILIDLILLKFYNVIFTLRVKLSLLSPLPSLPSIAFEATSPSSVLDCSAVRLYAKLTENCEILKSVNQITSQKKKVCKKG